MLTFYKIGETTSLCNISADILRYYEELGILVPRRASNGYRICRAEDLWCLNVIRDLRELGFSIEQIKAYAENRSIDSSLELFRKEMGMIDRHIGRLKPLRGNIITRRETTSQVQGLPLGTITLKEMSPRACHRIMQSYGTDEEMDVLIKQLVSFGPDGQYIIGNNQVGFSVNLSDAMDERRQQYDTVFILHPDDEHCIGKGTYLSVCYSDNFHQTRTYVPRLLGYVREHSMNTQGPLLELLWIDARTAEHVEKQVTKLQSKVDQIISASQPPAYLFPTQPISCSYHLKCQIPSDSR